MAKPQVQMMVFVIIVSLSWSYSLTKCFGSKEAPTGSAPFTVISEIKPVELEAFRDKLDKAGVPLAQVLSTKSYSDGGYICKVYIMNVFEISSQAASLSGYIKETYARLISKLEGLGDLKEFEIEEVELMFEPSTNRLVVADVEKIMDSKVYKASDPPYKDFMSKEIQKVVEKLEKNNSIFVSANKTLQKEIEKISKIPNSTFLEPGFEKLYSASNPAPRSTIRKVAKDLPDVPDESRSSTLTIKKNTERNPHVITAFIDDVSSHQIAFDSTNSIITLFVCNYDQNRYKICKVMQLFESSQTKSVSTKIEKGQKIRADIYSKRLVTLLTGEDIGQSHNKLASVYSYEVFLVLVPESTPGIDSTQLFLAPLTAAPFTRKVFFVDDEENVLKTAEHYTYLSMNNLKELGQLSNAVAAPKGLKLIQVPYSLTEFSDSEEPNLSYKFYYLEVPIKSTLTFIDQKSSADQKSSLYLYEQGYDVLLSFFPYCTRPMMDLHFGAKNNQMLVAFRGKTVEYPDTIKLISNAAIRPNNSLCLAGDQRDGFFFTIEDDSKYNFYWNFNAFRLDYHLIYLTSNFELDFAPPFDKFEVPKSNSDLIFVSVMKIPKVSKSSGDCFSVEAVFFNHKIKKIEDQEDEYEDEIYRVVFEENWTTIASLQKEYSEGLAKQTILGAATQVRKPTSKELKALSKQQEKLEKTLDEIDKQYLDFKVKFESFPTQFQITKGKAALSTFSLTQAKAVYLSEDEIVYSFANTLPENCNPHFDKSLPKTTASKSDLIWIKCDENPAQDASMRPQVFYSGRNQYQKGLNQVISQTFTINVSAANNRII